MDTKSIVIALLVVLTLGVFLPIGKDSQTVVERVSESLGGVASPDFAIGAVNLYSQGSEAFTQATNTVLCSLQAPASTSTLISATFKVTTATSGVTYLGISKSTTAGAIGTGVNLFASTTVASGAGSAFTAASSTQGAPFAPNTFLNFSQTNGGIMNQSGACEALWQVI